MWSHALDLTSPFDSAMNVELVCFSGIKIITHFLFCLNSNFLLLALVRKPVLWYGKVTEPPDIPCTYTITANMLSLNCAKKTWFFFFLVISVEFLYNSAALTNISAKKNKTTRSRQHVGDKLTIEFFLETWEYFMDSDNMADLTGDFGTLPQAEDTGRTLVYPSALSLQTDVLSVVLLAIFTCSPYLRNMRCSSIVTCCSSKQLPGCTCHGLHVTMLIKKLPNYEPPSCVQ